MVPFYLKSYNSTPRTVFVLFIKSFKCVDMNFKFKKSISANSNQLRSMLELLGIPPSLTKKTQRWVFKNMKIHIPFQLGVPRLTLHHDADRNIDAF